MVLRSVLGTPHSLPYVILNIHIHPIVLMFTARSHGQLSIGERFLCTWHGVTRWLGVSGGPGVAPRLGRWLWAHSPDSGPTWTLLSRLHICATVLSSASCRYSWYLGCGVL